LSNVDHESREEKFCSGRPAFLLHKTVGFLRCFDTYSRSTVEVECIGLTANADRFKISHGRACPARFPPGGGDELVAAAVFANGHYVRCVDEIKGGRAVRSTVHLWLAAKHDCPHQSVSGMASERTVGIAVRTVRVAKR